MSGTGRLLGLLDWSDMPNKDETLLNSDMAELERHVAVVFLPPAAADPDLFSQPPIIQESYTFQYD